MKKIFVVLACGVKNYLEIAQNIVHSVEMELDTYCELIPFFEYVQEFSMSTKAEIIKPIDFLHYCIGYMREADIIVFDYDWQSHKECSLLHAIALAYSLDIVEMEQDDYKGKKEVVEAIEVRACPFCKEHKELSIMKHGGIFAVHCGKCNGVGPIADTKREAILAWNGTLKKSQEVNIYE